MLDSDLASLYGYEVKAFNQQVKRNKERFPDDFIFQLTETETIEISRSQFVTSIQTLGVKGGRSYIPYVFTEQGIYMLATVLKGDIATQQSIVIMRTFKEMRHYVTENQSLLNNADILKLSNTVYENKKDIANIKESMATKNDINTIMESFIEEDKIKEIVILNGQKFEALEAYNSIDRKAKYSIYIVDDYINIHTLSMLKKKKEMWKLLFLPITKGTEERNFNKEKQNCSMKSILI